MKTDKQQSVWQHDRMIITNFSSKGCLQDKRKQYEGQDANEIKVVRTCLQCGSAVADQYCARCGQEISTARFRLQHLFSRDLLHGMYNVNFAILNTLRLLVTRPGHAVREYVQGKRANFFHYFSFLILALTILHFVQEFAPLPIEKLYVTRLSRSVLSFNNDFIHRNGKLVAFILAPLVSLASYYVFKKAQQNFAEHCVLNIYKASAAILLLSIFYVLAMMVSNHTVLKVAYVIVFMLQITFEMYFYVQYFMPFGYSRRSLVLRSILMATLSVAFLIDKWIIFF